MAAIRGADTKPEMIIRRGLHASGFRFRLHDRKLQGRPDLVFSKYRAVLFVHGCFWHCHNCHLFRWPETRVGFWREKISANVAREKSSMASLHQGGWRIGVVWECAMKGRQRRSTEEVLNTVSDWLTSGTGDLTLAGMPENQSSEPVI